MIREIIQLKDQNPVTAEPVVPPTVEPPGKVVKPEPVTEPAVVAPAVVPLTEGVEATVVGSGTTTGVEEAGASSEDSDPDSEDSEEDSEEDSSDSEALKRHLIRRP